MGRHAETINQSKIKNFNNFHTIFDFNGKKKNKFVSEEEINM